MKRDDAADKGPFDRIGKRNKKNKKKAGGNFVAAADRKAGKAPVEDAREALPKC